MGKQHTPGRGGRLFAEVGRLRGGNGARDGRLSFRVMGPPEGGRTAAGGPRAVRGFREEGPEEGRAKLYRRDGYGWGAGRLSGPDEGL